MEKNRCDFNEDRISVWVDSRVEFLKAVTFTSISSYDARSNRQSIWSTICEGLNNGKISLDQSFDYCYCWKFAVQEREEYINWSDSVRSMDFLLFLFGYVGIFALIAVFIIFSNASPVLSPISEKLKDFCIKFIYTVVPGVVIRWVTFSVDYIFNTRNHVMQVVFGLLVLGGNIIFMLDVLPLLYIFEPDGNHIIFPLFLLFTNAIAFHMCAATDPGRVTPKNVAKLASLYKADGFMYKSGLECRTCRLLKPARSKHCKVCNHCVHRFDHHCIWTNSCIGAGNLRYFLTFLVTLMTMIVNGAIMSIRAMVLVVGHLKMMESGYYDPYTGQVLPITIPVLIQHLFMQQPRCIFLITSLVMLTFLLGLFTFYHIYLLIINQTTNERYKLSSLPGNNNNSSEHSDKQQAELNQSGFKKNQVDLANEMDKSKRNSDMKNDLPVLCKLNNNHVKITDSNLKGTQNLDLFYNRGILYNLKEVFLPWTELQEIKQIKSRNPDTRKHKRT
ncbi:putative palmitoyltransferase zdhhc4 [Bulinus truncatus]|nr:putative palmitoyltransferase zdhhc4 [Bulinus truncatus]